VCWIVDICNHSKQENKGNRTDIREIFRKHSATHEHTRAHTHNDSTGARVKNVVGAELVGAMETGLSVFMVGLADGAMVRVVGVSVCTVGACVARKSAESILAPPAIAMAPMVEKAWPWNLKGDVLCDL
jgi:hypothetical protein